MWVVSLLLVVLPSAVGESRFAAGKRLYAEARFAEAAQELEVHLRDAKGGERTDAALLLGASYVAIGKDAPAKRAFVEALDNDASASLPPRSSPKVREAFEKARTEYAALPPQLRWAEPAAIESPLGPGTRLRLRTRNLVGKAYAVSLFWRITQETQFHSTSIDVRPDGSATVDVEPGGTEQQTEIALFVEVREGRTLKLSLGSAERPTIAMVPVRRAGSPPATTPRVAAVVPPPRTTTALTQPSEVPASEDTPVYKKGWFWGVVGGAAVLVATGVVVGIVVANQSSKPPSGDLTVGFQTGAR